MKTIKQIQHKSIFVLDSTIFMIFTYEILVG